MTSTLYDKESICVCSECDAEFTINDKKCPQCGSNVDEIENAPKKYIACLLTFATVGLGHIYAGEPKKGIGLYLLTLGFSFLMSIIFLIAPRIALILLIIGVIALFIYILRDVLNIVKLKSQSYIKKNYNKWYVYLLIIFLTSFIIGPLLKETLGIKSYKIPSGAMEPTLLIGDHISINKFIYGISIPFIDKKILQFKKPERGDLVVFIYPEDSSKDFVKRVTAIGGDTIRIIDKKVFINDKLSDDPYGFYSDSRIINQGDTGASRDNFGPVTVPQDSLFVLGDNRDKSYDSRFWGFVKTKKVRGKVLFIYWSWESPFYNFRWSRIGMLL